VLFHRVHRRWLAAWLIVVLLFAQFATAAYGCPRDASVPGDAPTATMAPGCEGHLAVAMDPGQPQLCKAHCDQGHQTPSPFATPDLSASPMLLAVLDWTEAMLAPVLAPRSERFTPSGAAPPGSPPLYLALLVLRN
jgi:hypothetical protein